jgi:hypothetical protein
MNFNFVGFAFDMAMFGSGLGVGAFVALNRKPRARVIPPELLPVEVVCSPEPRRLETRGSSPSRVSEYAPRPQPRSVRLERFAAQSTAPSRHHRWTPEAAAPPPQPPQHDEVAARTALPSINWMT